MSDREIIRLFIEGRVQGVGYRAFLVREALALDLSGWARNRRDGAVEVGRLWAAPGARRADRCGAAGSTARASRRAARGAGR